jgi:hypothetical protein
METLNPQYSISKLGNGRNNASQKGAKKWSRVGQEHAKSRLNTMKPKEMP